MATIACGSSDSKIETVPPSVLDPDLAPPSAEPERVEYKLTEKDSTPIFPAPDSAYTTDSGLRFVVFKRGTASRHPKSTTEVTVHYTGYTSDEKTFDSSVDRGEPATFALKDVIPGWREGVKLMTVGDTFRFWIPEKEAYRGMPGKPEGLLIFDVELISMEADSPS